MKKVAKKIVGGGLSSMSSKFTANVFGLGEGAEPKSQIEKQNLIIKNKC